MKAVTEPWDEDRYGPESERVRLARESVERSGRALFWAKVKSHRSQ